MHSRPICDTGPPADRRAPRLRHNNTNLIYYPLCWKKAEETQVAFFPRSRPALQLPAATGTARAGATCPPQNKVRTVSERTERDVCSQSSGQPFFGVPRFPHLSPEVSRGRAPVSPPLSHYLSTCSPSKTRSVRYKWRIQDALVHAFTGQILPDEWWAVLFLNSVCALAAQNTCFLFFDWFYKTTRSHISSYLTRGRLNLPLYQW